MSPLRRSAVSVGLALLALAGLLTGSLLLSPSEAPLPSGAAALRIQTASWMPIPLGCQTALLVPITVGHQSDVMTFRSVASGEEVKVAWPHGWSARLIGSLGELVGPDGVVFARDGDVIANRLGGGTARDGTFVICSTDPIGNPAIPSQKPPERTRELR